jgi:hypothetical protein
MIADRGLRIGKAGDVGDTSVDSSSIRTAVKKAENVLPLSLPPRGLSRAQAAAYIGVSPSLFDEMVRDGRMPQPKRINNRTVWDLKLLDLAFAEIPSDDDANPWDLAA